MKIIIPSLLISMSTLTQASVLAFDPSPTSSRDTNDYSKGVGLVFQVSEVVTVTDLAFFGTAADPSAVSVTLQLWNVDTSTELVSYTVNGVTDSSESVAFSNVSDGLKFIADIADVSLTTGVKYMVSAHSLTNVRYVNAVSESTVASEIVFQENRYSSGAAGEMPQVVDVFADDPTKPRYGGPSFQYTVAVPEPSSCALLSLGLFSLVLRRKRASN